MTGSPLGATDAPAESRRSGTFETLSLRGVGRTFGKTAALKGLDLEIRRGEFIALLGPSGCGKSTALNCLAGLLPLTSGSIWQDETRIDVLPPERRGFGMVFQNYALFPHMSVRKNVAFGLTMRRLPKAETARRTEEAIRLVRLEEHAHKLPGQLSGGQQQRVAIARAIVLEPSLVLMDEPLSNLDAKLRLEMRTEIRRLHQSLGLTTVYVTHDQEEALSLADRLVILRAGTVQQIGTPEELHNRLDLVGTHLDDLTPGAAVVAAVRPEDVRLFEPGTTGDNRFPAIVEVVEYQGRELAVEARTESGLRWHLRTSHRLAPGDAVVLGVAVERLLVFRDDTAEAPKNVSVASERESV